MSEVKHTPGPWSWKSQDDHIVVIGPSGYYHATIIRAAKGDKEAAQVAVSDANLIAAAPAMYEALKDLRSYIIAYDGLHSAADLSRLDAIISLAEGNQ